MNINTRNKISFFEVHWDMNMQLVRDQNYYFGRYRIWSRDQLQFISQCTSKNDILFLKCTPFSISIMLLTGIEDNSSFVWPQDGYVARSPVGHSPLLWNSLDVARRNGRLDFTLLCTFQRYQLDNVDYLLNQIKLILMKKNYWQQILSLHEKCVSFSPTCTTV